MAKLLLVLALAVACFGQGYKRPRGVEFETVGTPLFVHPLEDLPAELLWHNHTGVDFLTVSKN